MHIFSIINNKGGVAKTSSVANLGAYFSYLEKKTLIVDTDPQSNLTQHFDSSLEKFNIKRTLYHAYVDFKEYGIKTEIPIYKINPFLYIVPASNELASMEKELATYNNNQGILTKLLKQFYDHFEFCFIDCPPSLGFLTDNAIVACNSVIIPIEASAFSYKGVDTIINYLEKLKLHNDLYFNLSGVFMSKFDIRESISEAVLSEVKDKFKHLMFNTQIRINTDIKKAQANGEDIFIFSRNSNSAKDYADLADEILERTSLTNA